MYRVCDSRLCPVFGVQPTTICGEQLRKCVRLRVLLIYVYGHAAAMTPILQLWLTITIKKLKQKVKSSKYKSMKDKSSLH